MLSGINDHCSSTLNTHDGPAQLTPPGTPRRGDNENTERARARKHHFVRRPKKRNHPWTQKLYIYSTIVAPIRSKRPGQLKETIYGMLTARVAPLFVRRCSCAQKSSSICRGWCGSPSTGGYIYTQVECTSGKPAPKQMSNAQLSALWRFFFKWQMAAFCM